MPVLARTVATPLTIDIRPGALGYLSEILSDSRITTRGAVAVAMGKAMGEVLADQIRESIPNAVVIEVESGTLEGAQRLHERLRSDAAEVVVGVGGGGTIDVAKWAASNAGTPFVSVATTLTHDGLASPVAVLSNDRRSVSYGAHMPIAVVVDLDLVNASPIEHIRSGIGDSVSNISAVADWRLGAAATGEAVDGLAASMSETAGTAVLGSTDETTSTGFLSTLAQSLVLGGIAMSLAGSSRPCSGACHEISHAIDSLFDTSTLHGEQVAVGSMFASFLRDDPHLDTLNECYRRHQVPRVPGDLGLDAGQFVEAVLAAPNTRPGRYTILEDLDLSGDQVEKEIGRFLERVG